jgi:hypothetical protein
MARAGQNPTQMPQLSQPLRRMTNWRFASTIAERGHTPSQAPQFMQFAVMVYPEAGIVSSSTVCACPAAMFARLVSAGPVLVA